MAPDGGATGKATLDKSATSREDVTGSASAGKPGTPNKRHGEGDGKGDQPRLKGRSQQDLGKYQQPPGLTAEQVHALSKLKIMEKLKKGHLHTITKKNVNDLFNILDSEDRGEISREDLFKLRQVPGFVLTEQDLTALAQDCDKDDSGKVSPEELFFGLTQGELAFTMVKAALGKAVKNVDVRSVELTQMIKYMQEEFQTSTALWTLPETFMLFSLFLVLSAGHLVQNTAFYHQTAIVNYVNNQGGMPHDVPTTWSWLDTTFMSIHFQQNLQNFPYPGRVATFSQIVGGIELVKTTESQVDTCSGSAALGSFYDTEGGGRCYRGGDTEDVSVFLPYHLMANYTLQELKNLSNAVWLDVNTSVLDVHTLYYNAHLQVFTDSHIKFNFVQQGGVQVTYDQETFQSDPYVDKRWIVPDIMFAAILMKMCYQETREVIPAVRNGMEGLRNYMELWNLIDWLSIILGAVAMAYWGMVCTGVSYDLQGLMGEFPKKELDAKIAAKQAYLTPAELEVGGGRQMIEMLIGKIHDVSALAASRHATLRAVVFWYSYVLQMKFFKAFGANPRLDIVIRTLTKSTVEILHFLIIFGVILLCFSSAAHVIWGKTMADFRGQWPAIFMCWKVLQGQFDVVTMELVNDPLSGFWFIAYNFLVFVILLNMLLAIIMDTYMAAKQEKGDPSEQLTIWHQIQLAFLALRETRGHLPLYTLLLGLQNENAPAHPAPKVTAKSLRRAFKLMSKHQADYLMRKTVEYVKAQEKISDLSFADAIRVLGLLKVNMLRNVDDTEQILQMARERMREDQEAFPDEDDEGNPETPSRSRPGSRPVSRSASMTASAAATKPAPAPERIGSIPRTKLFGYGGAATAGVYSGGNTTALPGQGMAGSVGSGGDTASDMQPIYAGVQTILAETKRISQLAQQRQMVVDQQILAHRKFTEERDSWLEDRLHELDHRIREVERVNAQLIANLQDADFHDLSTKLNYMANAARVATTVPGTNTPAARRGNVQVQPQVRTWPVRETIAEQVEDLAQQVANELEESERQFQELLARDEEVSQLKQLLWKIDLGLRNLNQAR